MKKTNNHRGLIYLITGIVRKEFLLSIRYPIEFVSNIATPLLMLIPILMLGKLYLVGGGSGFAEYTGTDNFSLYVVLGSLYLQFIENLFFDILSFVKKEMWMGTLEQLWLSPANKYIFLITRSFFSSLRYATYSIITLLLVYWVFKINLTLSFLSIIFGTLLYFVTLLAMQGFSLIFAGMVLVWKIETIPTILNAIMYVLAGAMYPITALPRFAQMGSLVLPQTYILDLLRFLFTSSQTIFSITQEIIILAILTIILPVLGLIIFLSLDKKNRISGTIGYY
jgi:ABC-2 type transport system permease protein